ncbi:ABC transporter ATP-binding protein [Spelaeicoccus albus]|uniref:Putative ABC transport system ATP-binding protein n=1 Tax=Spelaeicoccus albus TaxID=1280376 RepID=A0A7Z0D0J1_9MICO|nr:ABC transporter ATP-binding protein [Spelaeicoccus albus]NYI67406.1 putative ABC transport system ATP-binding protein [Spelaeicoccus albus]
MTPSLFDNQPQPVQNPDAGRRGPALTASGLVKTFGPARALAGVDVAIGPGESLAVMGPSGSGKSTLLHVLAGIMTPDAGTVALYGDTISGLSERARTSLRRRRFGFVFQFGQLLPELPAIENVALPLMLGGVPRRDAEARATGLFGPLGLAGLEARRPGELSGGQSQRVAVARALVTAPDVIFADEPTGSLDSRSGVEVMNLLTDACRGQGAALVLVTHDRQIAGWCERTITMRDGLVSGEYRRPGTEAGDTAPGVRAASGIGSGRAATR